MTTTEAEPLLELHRELCAAVRSADQAFARLYVAPPETETARQLENGYRLALARTRAALGALEVEWCRGADASVIASGEVVAATLSGARCAC